ncbi:MAG: putative Ig domain-containing protein, partial [Halofilum sp. (in: g-proteobacteria)]
DGSGEPNATQTDTFEWTVNNRAPTATDNSAGVTEDGPTSATGNVISDDDGSGTDSDPEDPTSQLEVSAVGGNAGDVGSGVTGSHGTVTIGSDGSYTYNLDNGSTAVQELAEGETLTDTFSYEVSDQEGGTDTASLTVTITGANDQPSVDTAIADQSSDDGETITPVDVSGNFSDVDASDALTFSATGLPPGLSIDPNTGEISGTIDDSASQNGPYNVTITVDDGSGEPNATQTDTFEWTVSNLEPTALDDTDTTDEDSAIGRNAGSGVLPNDDDTAPDGDALEVDQVAGGANVGNPVSGSKGGQFTINANGSYDFDPAGDFEDLAVGESEQTQVEYRVTDNEGGTDTATLTVTVNGVNDAPTGSPSDRNAVDGESINAPVGSAFADVDVSDTLTFAAADLPGGLSIDANTGVVTGTIDRDASQGGAASDGVYTVTVTVTDSQGTSIDRDFTWAVTNPAPVAADDTDTVQQGDNLNRGPGDGVLDNDADGNPDTDPLTVTTVDNGTIIDLAGAPVAGDNGGVFTIDPDGGYTFATNGDFTDVGLGESRDTTVTYAISDGEGGTDTATLTVTVTGDNEAPTARNIPDDQTPFGADYSNDVSGAFDDIDQNDELTYSIEGLPEGLEIDPDTGEIFGVPVESGLYDVTVTVTDLTGATVSEPFDLLVTPPAPPPGEPDVPGGGNGDPGLTDGGLLDPGGDGGFGGVTIELGLPPLLRGDGLFPGVESGLGGDGAPDAGLRYQATESDGSPLPEGLTVDPDTGEIKGRLPEGTERAELRVIGVDDKGNTRTREVVVGPDASIIARGEGADTEGGYHRMDVSVDTDGRVTVNAGAESNNDMIADPIRVDGGTLTVGLVDNQAAAVARYTGRLTSGEPLPDGIAVDPDTGRVRGTIPAGRDGLSIQIIAEHYDGSSRTLQVDLDLAGRQTAEAIGGGWASFGEQLRDALASEGDAGESAYGDRLMAALTEPR